MLLLDPQFDGFVTLFVGIYDTAVGRMTYASGGHEPPILYRRSTGERIELRTTGMIVGAFPDSAYAEDAVALEKGDVLLLFTDGLSEARNEAGMLGSDGLARILSDVACEKVSEYLDRIAGAAREYSGGRFRDDAAAILLSVR
jgi:sigma-B regulation protein RsbU (phosphoserine phosphatase)